MLKCQINPISLIDNPVIAAMSSIAIPLAFMVRAAYRSASALPLAWVRK
jgi:hypothetical protein